MHVHILGICGTFMGGIAALARASGHRVTGSDQNVYPPMSDQLAALGIELIEGYDPQQLQLRPDVVVVGNVMSRGNALVEALLESGIPLHSGPNGWRGTCSPAAGRSRSPARTARPRLRASWRGSSSTPASIPDS
jgi:UDP-N-acetylmuramate-alanine ligase